MSQPSLPYRLASMRTSRGFTLVELLVVISVMVVLGGMLTYALASATTQARVKRTQADVLSIGQLLQSRVNEVSLAPLSLAYGRSGLQLVEAGVLTGPMAIGGPGTGGLTTNAQRIAFMAQERARLTLLARRDMIRLVLPECQADLIYPPTSLQFRTYHTSGTGTGWLPNVAQVKPPPQWNRMRTLAGLLSAADIDAVYAVNGGGNASSAATNAEYDAIAQASNPTYEAILRHDARVIPFDSSTPTPIGWTREHESSECLYLILATTELFGQTAIDKIPDTQIEDTDGDGIPEILDAWGRPYEFVRNPIGFDSPTIKNFDPSGSTPAEQYPFDPDPFDFLAADLRFDESTHPGAGGLPASAYFPVFLPPMVVSAGLDGEFGLRLSYVNTDTSTVEPELGVNVGYSASSVRYPARTYVPSYPTVPIVRYPDPFNDVSAVPSNAPGDYFFNITAAGSIVTAKQGGGLGAILDRDLSADNITSLDAGM
ncbi:type II secretion system protein [Roseiconus lacunae]|uniref:Type II secretion system protein n=1 Tax=Roseiconus lacunae TaxID=2605694 RepID=A0ABT7PJ85_9BACT|nr:type II secretion system protein [Roseiconus lacunae]MDM4016552.1 type II secretion system protein [Roseiconus lacunae]